MGKTGAPAERRVYRADGWTEARRSVFLDVLSTCATVKTAAAAAGMDVSGVYHLRRRDPVFAAQWEEALATGYATIEAALLQRAAAAVDAADPAELDTELAKWMLSHRDRRGGQKPGDPRRMKTVSPKELSDAILAKLDVLDRRERAKRERAKAEGGPTRLAKSDAGKRGVKGGAAGA